MAINSDPQDGIDAARRARRDHGQWHPIMAAHEIEPGHWVMVDEALKPYGVIRFVRRGDQVGYRADCGQPATAKTESSLATSPT